MSYDLEICVKVEDTNIFVRIDRPDYDSPTYNLGKLFRKCMDWDFKQEEYYNCSEVIGNISRGLLELEHNRDNYKQYQPTNGWGNIDDAMLTLTSLRDCILENSNKIPMQYLYVKW